MERALNPVYYLTLAWLALSTLAFGPEGWQAKGLVIAVKIAPLLVFLPAVRHRRANGLMALALLLLFYVGYTTMLCFKAGAEGWSGGLGTLLVMALLVVSQLEVKRQGKLRKASGQA